MDPTLLKRPPSTSCNCWNGSVSGKRHGRRRFWQWHKKWRHSKQQNRGKSVRNLDRKERWRTWSFNMGACCVAYVTKLCNMVNEWMDDEALDTGRTCPVRDGVKRWRSMVTCWEPRAFDRCPKALQAILVMKWNIPRNDVTQLVTVWIDQVKDCEQQRSNKTLAGSGAAGMQERMTIAIRWQLKYKQQLSVSLAARKDSPRRTVGQRKSTRTEDDDDKRSLQQLRRGW